MDVFIINFGYAKLRYLPMFELFLADALGGRGIGESTGTTEIVLL